MPSKRIVVCCDGTSNTAYRAPGASPSTNVWRIARYIKQTASNDMPQYVWYQSGLGTASGSLRRWNQAWAKGIREKILEAYNDICLNYAEGDEIILIGFSRGAFTVRCVVDLIVTVGILSKEGLGADGLHTVFSHWWNNEDAREDHKKFRFTVMPSDTRNYIKACGLWDTVHSVGRAGIIRSDGIAGFEWKGPRRLAPGWTAVTGVDYIFHALSLHERRSLFEPEMISIAEQQQLQNNACELEQCWFSGYHGDIGGGRKDDALAHLALAWMMAKLQFRHILDFDINMFWRNEMATSSWRANSSGDNAVLDVADTLTLPWGAVGWGFRRPGLAMINPHAPGRTHECIHRTVFQLTFPFTTTMKPPSPPEHPPVIAPCWSLKGVVPRAANPPAHRQARIWPLRPAKKQLTKERHDVEIPESTHLLDESVLVQIWVQTAHGTALDQAVEGDETETPLLTILPRLFQLPQT